MQVSRKAASTQQLLTLPNRLGKNHLLLTSQSSRLQNQVAHSIANPATGIFILCFLQKVSVLSHLHPWKRNCNFLYYPSCRSFNSDNALQSHTKAKHSAGKWMAKSSLPWWCFEIDYRRKKLGLVDMERLAYYRWLNLCCFYLVGLESIAVDLEGFFLLLVSDSMVYIILFTQEIPVFVISCLKFPSIIVVSTWRTMC